MWPKIQDFISGTARSAVVIWLVIFSLMSALTIYNQHRSHERTVAYALTALEEIQYKYILKMRDEQELKERYLWLVKMTSLDLSDIDPPRVPKLSVSMIGD